MRWKRNKKTSPLPQTENQIIDKNDTFSIPQWAPFVVMLFTALLYCKSLFNDFLYWDDDDYILKNNYLRNFSLKGVFDIFSKFNNANYHPFTTLTNLFEYHLFGLAPLPYHLLNLALHLLNTWLVFIIVERLSCKRLTALIVCILFAIHPLHVESVTWLSERKDVLYSAFYLLSLLAYLRYLASGFSKKQYIYALLLFIASCLSKSAAITLPVLLIAVDIYKERKITVKALIEKVPFILLSVLFGIFALLSQKAGGAVHYLSDSYGFLNRIFLFTSRIAFYIIESIVPFRLTVLNYLPDIKGNILPWYYYGSLPFLLALVWLVAVKIKYKKEVLFGIAFFLITISIMLQIVNVGSALTAERYTYIPYLGLFYIAGQWVAAIINKHNKYYVICVSFIFVIIFSALTWNRISVWKNTDTVVYDMLKKNPGSSGNSIAYNARGNFRYDKGDKQGAVQDFTNTLAIDPVYEQVYFKRGLIYNELGEIQNALNDFNKAVHLNPKQANYYNNRGLAFYEAGNKDAAMIDYNEAIKLDSGLAEAYNNRGCIYYSAGDLSAAATDFDKAIINDPEFAGPYYNRAAIKVKKGDLFGSIDDYTNIIKYHPTDSLAYFTRGLVHQALRDSIDACKDWQKAKELGNNSASEKLKQYCH